MLLMVIVSNAIVNKHSSRLALRLAAIANRELGRRCSSICKFKPMITKRIVIRWKLEVVLLSCCWPENTNNDDDDGNKLKLF